MSKAGDFSHYVRHVRRSEPAPAEAARPDKVEAPPIRAARRRAIRMLREALAYNPSPGARANARMLLDRWSPQAGL